MENNSIKKTKRKENVSAWKKGEIIWKGKMTVIATGEAWLAPRKSPSSLHIMGYPK